MGPALPSGKESSRICWRNHLPADDISLPITSHHFSPVGYATRAGAAACWLQLSRKEACCRRVRRHEDEQAAVSSPVLHCPQRTQRCLLRLSQALDPSNIEALVGPVAPQRPHMLAALEIPDVDGPVLPATGQPAAIGTHLERMHRPLMGLLHPHALPALHVPPAQPAVTPSTDKPLPTR